MSTGLVVLASEQVVDLGDDLLEVNQILDLARRRGRYEAILYCTAALRGLMATIVLFLP